MEFINYWPSKTLLATNMKAQNSNYEDNLYKLNTRYIALKHFSSMISACISDLKFLNLWLNSNGLKWIPQHLQIPFPKFKVLRVEPCKNYLGV